MSPRILRMQIFVSRPWLLNFEMTDQKKCSCSLGPSDLNHFLLAESYWMFDLGYPDSLVIPVAVNHFVASSMKKIVILKTALLGSVRACSLKVNWATEKTGSVALLPFVVFHIPEETKHSE